MSKRCKKSICGLAAIFTALILILVCLFMTDSPYIIIIEDNIAFTNDSPKNRLSIPAAYTDSNGNIEGEYVIDGVVYGKPSRLERISLIDNGFVISRDWKSDYGFQQTVLIKNGVKRSFKDQNKAFRRALCTVDGQLAILQSTKRQTLNEFIKTISFYCDNAVNLDMGKYGYAVINGRPLFMIAKPFKEKQTNWITIKQ